MNQPRHLNRRQFLIGTAAALAGAALAGSNRAGIPTAQAR